MLALFLFPLEAPNQVIWVVSGSNAVENDSRLFFALVMFKRFCFNCWTNYERCYITWVVSINNMKGNGLHWNSPSQILMAKSKNIENHIRMNRKGRHKQYATPTALVVRVLSPFKIFIDLSCADELPKIEYIYIYIYIYTYIIYTYIYIIYTYILYIHIYIRYSIHPSKHYFLK